MRKLIAFDVDGTFLDSYGLYEKAIADYCRDNGLQHPCLKSIREGYHDPLNHDYKWGMTRQEQYDHLIATFRLADEWSLSGEHGKTPQLFHGAEEAFIHLKDLGYTLAIVTSKGESPLLHLLEYHSIHKLFSAYRSWDDCDRRGEKEKPEPDQLQSVMRELKFSPEETVMVGDTTMDIQMGRSAGASTIGVTWGTHPVEHLIGAGAHHIVDTHFPDVVPVVKKIFA